MCADCVTGCMEWDGVCLGAEDVKRFDAGLECVDVEAKVDPDVDGVPTHLKVDGDPATEGTEDPADGEIDEDLVEVDPADVEGSPVVADVAVAGDATDLKEEKDSAIVEA